MASSKSFSLRILRVGRGNISSDTWLYDIAANPSKFWQIFPQASDRVPFTKGNFYAEILPILLLWYLLGVLVQLPNTRKLRLAVLPIIAGMSWQAGTRYNYNPSPQPGNTSGHLLGCVPCWTLFFIVMRSIEFAMAKQYKRIKWSILSEDTPRTTTTRIFGAVWDALDLVWNPRGIGWDWGKNIHVPPNEGGDGSPGSATSASGHLASFVKVQILFDFALFAQQSWTLYPSDTLPTHPAGGTIFDPTLPPLLRCGKVVAMTFLCALGLCCSFQAIYNVMAAFSIAILRQKPEQWPPLFHAPWRAESLVDFWGTRWHQVMKRVFVKCGAIPGFLIAGRIGGVIGAFFVSGVIHDVATWGAGMGAEFSTITMFFTMMGVGIVLEALFTQRTGFRVRGPLGWAWAMAWMFFWGSWIVDAWTRRGVFVSKMSADEYRPALYWAKIVQKWVSLHGERLAQ
ncbi:hypothetical protein PENSPDRAFT_689775 [Peniophora sp. CONT]|nr:hypothetical protein PENSPDRAFT_689775 [Peniophora sp. CONT]